MIFLLLFVIQINAIDTNECFELINANVVLSENQLTIKGEGKMCDCYNNKLTINKENVKTLVFQNSITSIGNKCFMNFVNLTSITFSSSIQEIEQYAFYNTKLTQITIPQSVKLIESNAFGENKELESINFEEGINELSIQPLAFENNEKLQKFIYQKD